MIVPRIPGCTWHAYANVPVVENVLATPVFVRTFGMSAGAPATASKNTLCPTLWNVIVTLVPRVTVSDAGLNVILGVAST